MFKSLSLIILISCTYSGLFSQWDYYEATWEGKPGDVVINMDWRNYAPVEDLPFLLEVICHTEDCDDRGYPSSVALDNTDQIANQIDSIASLLTYIESVGTMTHDCKVRDFFYIADTTGVRSAIYKLPLSNALTLRMIQDKDWRGYLYFLYPDAYLRQTMINAKIVKEMIKAGEDVNTSRRLIHYAGFTTPAEREKYRTFILEQGFRIEEELDDNASLAPYQFVFSRRDKTSIDWISDITLKLSDRAAELNGAYDGWEIEINGN